MLLLILATLHSSIAINCGTTDHDGWFCGFNKVQLCVQQQELTSYSCGLQGCVQSKCDYNIGFCQGRLNGWYCDTKNLQLQLQCQNGEQNPVGFNLCNNDQQCNTNVTNTVTCVNKTSTSNGSAIVLSASLTLLFVLLFI
jgi:hypothetical protein